MDEQIGYHPETNVEEQLRNRIQVLSDEVWEGNAKEPELDRWLANFTGRIFDVPKERLHALQLLAHFDYFGASEIREMLKCVFRDHFRYELVQRARKKHGGTRDSLLLEREFQSEVKSTRFLGMGNPSESGAHLLYYFRQINGLSKTLFIHQHEILENAAGSSNNSFAIPGLRRLVFIDDLMGSGQQATAYSRKLLDFVRLAANNEHIDLEIWYFTLFASNSALEAVRKLPFDRVEAVNEIDDTERAFTASSRVYLDPPTGISQTDGQTLAREYGSRLVPASPLGYANGQMLLGFHHNVPDNSLPIFWLNELSGPWQPIFPRYNKVYAS